MDGRRLYDVAVIGGGPAGSTVALFLAKQGVNVAVLEKCSVPRYKTCGGGVVQRAMRLLPASARGAVERECFAAELHLSDSDLHFSVSRPRPIVFMTMRDRLDFSLLSSAADAGASVYTGRQLIDLRHENGVVELQTNRGSLSAHFAVAADGTTSLTARKAGWMERLNVMPALESEIWVDDSTLEKFSRGARFDLGVIDHGYAWVFPKREHLSVGLLSTRRGRADLRGFLERYLKLLSVKRIDRVEHHGYVIPSGPRKGPLVLGRVILVGDAAGLVDPMTAEGITYAVWSGQLAARAIIDGDFSEDRVKHIYETAVEEAILPELRYGRLLARVIYGASWIRTSFLGLYGDRLIEALTNVFIGEKTYGGYMRDPANYLKLLTFSFGKNFRKSVGTGIIA